MNHRKNLNGICWIHVTGVDTVGGRTALPVKKGTDCFWFSRVRATWKQFVCQWKRENKTANERLSGRKTTFTQEMTCVSGICVFLRLLFSCRFTENNNRQGFYCKWLKEIPFHCKTKKRLGILRHLCPSEDISRTWGGFGVMIGLASHWCRGRVELIFVFVFPPSLKIHYTAANGDLMRTSLVDRPSCVAQGRLITAWFPDQAVWQDGMEKADGADSQAV